MTNDDRLVIPFEELRIADVPLVGGKNASLGEMIAALRSQRIDVPDGYAVTAAAYWRLVAHNDVRPVIASAIEEYHAGLIPLRDAGRRVRSALAHAELPDDLDAAIRDAYSRMCAAGHTAELPVAVRSSATAEDLPDASFAGQHESYLNVTGADAVVAAYRECVASMFTDRAIAYRDAQGFDHLSVALSVGVQRMVRSDAGAAGVMFSIDTETGFPDLVVIDGAWGLGEGVVKGEIDPDRFRVFKPLLGDVAVRPIVSRERGRKLTKIVNASGGTGSTAEVATSDDERRRLVLSDDQILQLARWAAAIEAHYGRPMDIEWALDGVDGGLFIVQARPETVHARAGAAAVKLRISGRGPVLAQGVAVGDGAAVGPVCRLSNASEIDRFPDGAVLVAELTDPDWVPVMAQGGGALAAMLLPFKLGAGGRLGSGKQWMSWVHLDADGIGLARMEFIVSERIRCHPMALAHPERIDDPGTRAAIAELTDGWDRPEEYFVDTLADGIAMLATPFWPHPTILRLSDFKTNEYAKLLGGEPFEPDEENPMIGWRGASRYYHPGYRDGFALECRAIKEVRDRRGFTNVVVMVPFCRTPAEADRVLEVMAEEGLVRGENGLEVYVMAEIPSNILRADEFAQRFDGFSIGSNDLTQLTLGIDRDSEILSGLGDASDPAVLGLISRLIPIAHEHGRKVGFCGQAPSNEPAYARFLADEGIDSVSVTPDSFISVKRQIADAESAR